MLRTILKEVKEFKRASIATPIYMILEVLMEMLIPFLMASIIDQGVNAGNIHHIYKVGGLMIVAALLGLLAGMAGGRYGAKASAGLARNLREAMFNNIQTFSFANIDRFSTAGSGNSSDDRCYQYSERIPDVAAYVYACTGKHYLRHDDGIFNQ